jgi:hypothetical protein
VIVDRHDDDPLAAQGPRDGINGGNGKLAAGSGSLMGHRRDDSAGKGCRPQHPSSCDHQFSATQLLPTIHHHNSFLYVIQA